MAIFGHCSLIERNTKERNTLESVHEIREAGDRAANLVRQLMSFSRHRPISKESVNLRTALQQLGPLLARIVGQETKLKIEAEEDCAVFINPSQFDQVILNRCTNARDAMPSGGTLRVELATTTLSSRSPRAR